MIDGMRLQANPVTDADVLGVIRSAVQEAATEIILDDRMTEPFRASVKRDFDTACWAWTKSGHRVFVGDGILNRSRAPLSDADVRRYTASYVRHEMGHALYTERDAKAVSEELNRLKLPFGLFNLVEDARIEARYRQEADDGFTFSWLDFEELAPAPEIASEAAWVNWSFFCMTQAEGDDARLAGPSAGVGSDAASGIAAGRSFYDDAVRCKDSFEVMALARKLLDRYPELASLNNQRCSLETGISMSGDAGAAALAAFEADADAPKSKDPAALHTADEDAGTDESGYAGCDLLAEGVNVVLDKRRVQSLAALLQKLKGGSRTHREYTPSPGKRLSIRHVLAGDARWHYQASTTAARKPKVLLVLDVSGSMNGSPLEEACHLVSAMSACTRQGLLSGDVLLSTTAKSGTRWMHKRLPWADHDTERLRTHEAEGLAHNLRANEALMDAADAVYVFTDAMIGGKPIPHERYAHEGRQVTGLYCNSDRLDLEDVQEAMAKHFQRFVVRESVETLIDEVVSRRI